MGRCFEGLRVVFDAAVLGLEGFGIRGPYFGTIGSTLDIRMLHYEPGFFGSLCSCGLSGHYACKRQQPLLS